MDVKQSSGRILCSTIFRPGGKKLLAKGHVLSEEDIRLLETEGMRQVWVTELEDGEVGEDDAVMAVAEAVCCGSVEIRLAAGGRANIVATENCCTLIDDELLKQINCTSSVVIATVPNYKFAKAGERVATVKSAPFAVAQSQLEATLSILNERGAILQARPVRDAGVAVLYTDPVDGGRARTLFETVVHSRLDKYGASLRYALASVEDEDQVTRSIQHLERFLAPVEPGNLMMLSYKDDVPIVSAPTCFRSIKPNVLDLILPPMLAKYRITGWEVACLGHGGLLS